MLAGGGLHDAHAMVFDFIQLGMEEFNSARRASRGSFTAMPQCENIARSKTKQKLGVGGVAWCVWCTVVVFKVRVVAKSAFVDVGVVVEVDVVPVVAGKAWRSEGGTAAKGNHLAALVLLARS